MKPILGKMSTMLVLILLVSRTLPRGTALTYKDQIESLVDKIDANVPVIYCNIIIQAGVTEESLGELFNIEFEGQEERIKMKIAELEEKLKTKKKNIENSKLMNSRLLASEEDENLKGQEGDSSSEEENNVPGQDNNLDENHLGNQNGYEAINGDEVDHVYSEGKLGQQILEDDQNVQQDLDNDQEPNITDQNLVFDAGYDEGAISVPQQENEVSNHGNDDGDDSSNSDNDDDGSGETDSDQSDDEEDAKFKADQIDDNHSDDEEDINHEADQINDNHSDDEEDVNHEADQIKSYRHNTSVKKASDSENDGSDDSDDEDISETSDSDDESDENKNNVEKLDNQQDEKQEEVFYPININGTPSKNIYEENKPSKDIEVEDNSNIQDPIKSLNNRSNSGEESSSDETDNKGDSHEIVDLSEDDNIDQVGIEDEATKIEKRQYHSQNDDINPSTDDIRDHDQLNTNTHDIENLEFSAYSDHQNDYGNNQYNGHIHALKTHQELDEEGNVLNEDVKKQNLAFEGDLDGHTNVIDEDENGDSHETLRQDNINNDVGASTSVDNVYSKDTINDEPKKTHWEVDHPDEQTFSDEKLSDEELIQTFKENELEEKNQINSDETIESQSDSHEEEIENVGKTLQEETFSSTSEEEDNQVISQLDQKSNEENQNELQQSTIQNQDVFNKDNVVNQKNSPITAVDHTDQADDSTTVKENPDDKYKGSIAKYIQENDEQVILDKFIKSSPTVKVLKDENKKGFNATSPDNKYVVIVVCKIAKLDHINSIKLSMTCPSSQSGLKVTYKHRNTDSTDEYDINFEKSGLPVKAFFLQDVVRSDKNVVSVNSNACELNISGSYIAKIVAIIVVAFTFTL